MIRVEVLALGLVLFKPELSELRPESCCGVPKTTTVAKTRSSAIIDESDDLKRWNDCHEQTGRAQPPAG